MDYDVDVVIVGGGLSGLSAGITATKNNLSAIVLERGDYSGSKNVTGGRMYVHSLRKLLGDQFSDEYLELPVYKDTYEIYAKDGKISFSFEEKNKKNSYTVLRSKFDRYLSGIAEENGCTVSYSTLVKGISRENNLINVITDRGDIKTPLVIEADGSAALISRLQGRRLQPKYNMLGVKEVIENKTDRDYGETRTILGLTGDLKGGAFVYENRDTLSVGFTVKIESLQDDANNLKSSDLIEQVREKLGIDGKMLEYSAHMIPYYGYGNLPPVNYDNILVAGDSAGFLINDGFTIRGMDLAIESGMIAGNAAKIILDSGDYSNTEIYKKMLDESFIMNDMKVAWPMFNLLGNKDLFTKYPDFFTGVLSELMNVDGKNRRKPVNVVFDQAHQNGLSVASILRDAMRVM
ncbi:MULTISPECIES: FAD-dependent oxidoreductase [Acidiplasma]|jgi:electron transfer flavoprotein-quinone oxidoreductase|uniref:FAD-dependent oxidoreductase n=2 Tax=Acidiplasma TaxID=507753 RepID=A0A0Q0VR67_9ARCH|nr:MULTISPECIES: FAD-dependent oxidoreductase [Acidiplasma]KJE48824.1 FAD-dependent oxidoreductase [Acidiplasma sp. MBA-1]KPV47257.1 FAD-dependent oxidoreductase [Acidiplasma aeolicum]KQB33642.1 FAD-dependent oxidoreductase [Acidiplasma cupricumulans]KQB34422.1 FAD-dependent oxidoreductase [Acidiplasma aeolicum]WMT54217.1 MAG: NAD(P)-binding domain-containing protein [Acidiplasma sp.]